MPSRPDPRHGRFRMSYGPATVAERIGATVGGGAAAEMGVENFRSRREIALLHEVDHALHGFTFIDRIGNHALKTRAKPDRVLGLLRRNAVKGISIVLDKDDILFDDLLA